MFSVMTEGGARRGLAAGIASLMALVLASSAAGENSALELISTGPAGGNGAFHAVLWDASEDGSRVYFQTDESLVSADTDGQLDVYERAGGQTTLVSIGPDGGNGEFSASFEGAPPDGARTFFSTEESLVSADIDAAQDVYERAGGQTTLVSTGPAGGDDEFLAGFRGASDDGGRVFFVTEESLVSSDMDSATDVYERAAGETTLVSTGPVGGQEDVFFVGVSDDGARVFMETEGPLVSEDTDTSQDVYERAGGQTTLVSTGPASGGDDFSAGFSRASDDGGRVLFGTREALVSADTDMSHDVYARVAGETTLVSTGPDGGNDDFAADFRGASADAARVFFVTDESLVSADSDMSRDVYERTGDQTILVSTGPEGGDGELSAQFAGASADGSRVFIETDESLVGADTDGWQDVYERAGGHTTLVSTGPDGGSGDFSAEFDGASDDGARIFFRSDEPLASPDTDTTLDVYERSGGQTTLLSTGPDGGDAEIHAFFWGASTDGSHVFIGTQESLLSSDTDSVFDIYKKRISAPESAPPPGLGPGDGAAPRPAPIAPVGPLSGPCANAKSGTAGIDKLTGGAFGDRLLGRAGDDVLIGRAGHDCLSGGRGRDRLSGGRGRDALSGGRGNDTINSRDRRRETVRCGKGTGDRVRADRGDRLIGCERITRAR